MSGPEYAWRGKAITGVDVTEAGETLARIEERDGSIKPQAVVDEARPEASPIHRAFEWNDKNAANAHRKWQARNLIRRVRVVTTNDAGEAEETSAFIHVGPDAIKVQAADESREGGYYSAARVVNDTDLFDRAMRHAADKLVIAQRSVQELRDMAAHTEQRDKLQAIALVAQSLATAARALETIH